MSKPGSVWVDGEELHFIDGAGVEWYYEGDLKEAAPAEAQAGSMWVEEANDQVCFVSETGDIRCLPRDVSESVSNAKSGSIWINDSHIKYIDPVGDKVQAGIDDHSDQEHSDSGHDNHSDNSGHNNHSDSGHDDHSNSHSNSSHYNSGHDNHSDNSGHDNHSNSHNDTGHGDAYYHHNTGHDDHSDNSGHDDHWNSSGHNDHHDSGHDNHSDNSGHNNHSDNSGHDDHEDGTSSHDDHTDKPIQA